MVMNEIIGQLIINSILFSIALGCVYAIYKSFRIKYSESRLSNRSIKGWKTRKSYTTKAVVSVKISVRHIPVNINGLNAGEIIIRKAI